MFKKLSELIELKLTKTAKEIEALEKQLNNRELDIKKKWDLESGEKFNDLICKYPISEEELLSMAETVCKFVEYTRITNINKYLFENEELTIPRIIKN